MDSLKDLPVSEPNPLSKREQQELEDIQKVISRRGADTPIELFHRFGELRKKHADHFFHKRQRGIERRVEHWKEPIPAPPDPGDRKAMQQEAMRKFWKEQGQNPDHTPYTEDWKWE